MHPQLTVRELQYSDIALLVNYWMTSDVAHLEGMGVDPAKLPSREDFTSMLEAQLALPIEAKRSFCIIWEADGQPIGHSNTNPTQFGVEATMHLHLWKSDFRKKGLGTELVRLTLPHFFQTLQIQKLICEPYALNPAPNHTLQKVGFTLVKEYTTIPGSLNFEQPVKRWELTKEQFWAL